MTTEERYADAQAAETVVAAPDTGRDAWDVMQAALDRGGIVRLGSGRFVVGKTLTIGSDTTLIAEEDTVVFTADHSKHTRHDFLLTNKDKRNGNRNITICGGIWDGNCTKNPRGKLFGGGYTGSMFDFACVTGLTLKDMRLINPECYYVRMCKVRDFVVDGIWFDSTVIRPDQDGIHLAGECFHGRISNLKGSCGSPNDDLSQSMPTIV